MHKRGRGQWTVYTGGLIVLYTFTNHQYICVVVYLLYAKEQLDAYTQLSVPI